MFYLPLFIVENINTHPPPLPLPCPQLQYHLLTGSLASSLPAPPPPHTPIGAGAGGLGENSSPVQAPRARGARPDLDKTVASSRKRKKGDIGLQEETLERPPGPSSEFGQAVQEQSRTQAQDLQGTRWGHSRRKDVEDTGNGAGGFRPNCDAPEGDPLGPARGAVVQGRFRLIRVFEFLIAKEKTFRFCLS